MGTVRYRSSAEDDLYEIALYTAREWGNAQADRYLSGLEEFCQLISDFPLIGRDCSEIAIGLRRMEYKAHVVFFFSEQNGILVSRVFRKSRDPFVEEFEDE